MTRVTDFYVIKIGTSKTRSDAGRSDRVRTCGLNIPNVARSQLRHTPIRVFKTPRYLLYIFSCRLSMLFSKKSDRGGKEKGEAHRSEHHIVFNFRAPNRGQINYNAYIWFKGPEP